MNAPQVSILVPNRNYAQYLPEMLDSVLAQDFADYEVLIVDNASQDDSQSVIERYAARDARIRFVLNREDRGMVPNWNHCLESARGEYIKFVFADDRLTDAGALRRMVEVLDTEPSVRLVASARRLIDQQSETLGVWGYGSDRLIRPGIEVISECLLSHSNPIGEPTAVLFRRADAERKFDERYRQIVDLEMWLHLLQRGDFAYLAEPCCCFRRHAAQESESNRPTRVSNKEYSMLLRTYMERGLITGVERSVLFEHAYRLRKIEHPDAETIELLRQLRERLGASYYLHYVRYKLLRPLYNLRRSLRGAA